MWVTNAPRFDTEQETRCWFFGAIDDQTDELLGRHVAEHGDRWAALELITERLRQAFRGFAKVLAARIRQRDSLERTGSAAIYFTGRL